MLRHLAAARMEAAAVTASQSVRGIVRVVVVVDEAVAATVAKCILHTHANDK